MKSIVISSEGSTSPNSLEFGARLGTEHYSYRFVAKRFEHAFSSAGFAVNFLHSPESYKHRLAFDDELRSDPANIVHISFRSTSNLRLLVGATNIVHFAWEFPFLKSETAPYEPITRNQLHMLGLMDYIWVPCRYTYDVLSNYGLKNVSIIPEPVCRDASPKTNTYETAWELLRTLPVTPFVLSSEMNRDDNIAAVRSVISSYGGLPTVLSKRKGGNGRVFLTVCNPGDLRKNLLNIVEGFQLAIQGSIEDVLIVKLVVPNTQEFRVSALYDHVLPLINGPGVYCDQRIQLITDFLSDEEMAALYSSADYYICASHCEGFNLPLLEAMSFGVLPITTANTAMADYIDETVGVLISEKTFTSPVQGMAGDVAGRVYPLSFASRFDIARAIFAALSLPPVDRARRARAAQERIATMYNEVQVMEMIRQRAPYVFASEPSQVERS